MGRGVLAFAVACGSRLPAANQSAECPGGNLVDPMDWHLEEDDVGQLLHIEAIGWEYIDWHFAQNGKVFLDIVVSQRERGVIRIPIRDGEMTSSDGLLQTGEWESRYPFEPSGWYFVLAVYHDWDIILEPETRPVEVCRDEAGNVYLRSMRPEANHPISKERP